MDKIIHYPHYSIKQARAIRVKREEKKKETKKGNEREKKQG